MPATQRISSALFLFIAFFACAFAPGCTCESERPVPKSSQILACVSKGARSKRAPPLTAKTTIAGTNPVSVSVGAYGEPAIQMVLDALPSRGIDPDLTLAYNGGDSSGALGGFIIAAGSVVTRCPMNMASHGQIRAVLYDEGDLESLCLDGKRLVVVGREGNTISYRTLPDTKIKVVGHFEDPASSYLEAFLPSGDVMTYATRPMAGQWSAKSLAGNGTP
jgi:hypothetical protein